MKKTMFILFLTIIFSALSAGRQEPVKQNIDTVPKAVQDQAKIRTDRKIDSIYSTFPLKLDAVLTGFRDLRGWMDSMHVELIMKQQESELAAIERDKAMHQTLLVIESYAKLKNEKQESDRIAQFAANWPTWCMVFILAIAGSYFGAGVANGFHKSRKNEK